MAPLTAAVARVAPPPSAIFADGLVAIRADMLRFARMQLRDGDAAEDLVQEAIEAALRHAASFGGQSSLKTWVFAILKNRIIDHLRQARRTVALSSFIGDGAESEGRLEALFAEHGAWSGTSCPVAWPDPEAAMQTLQFWLVFGACLEQLPPRASRVFMMREVLGFESDEICAQLGITSGNCHVILHRARLKLRAYLEDAWGRPEPGGC